MDASALQGCGYSQMMVCMQCESGSFSASGASVCTACGAGKYLTLASGETEANSCTSVSDDMLSDACVRACIFIHME